MKIASMLLIALLTGLSVVTWSSQASAAGAPPLQGASHRFKAIPDEPPRVEPPSALDFSLPRGHGDQW